jgi:hypothetical protein
MTRAVHKKLKKLQIAMSNDDAASLSGADRTYAPPAGSPFFPGSESNPGIFPDFGRAEFPVRPIISRLAKSGNF